MISLSRSVTPSIQPFSTWCAAPKSDFQPVTGFVRTTGCEAIQCLVEAYDLITDIANL
jgi:hypothetical protein